MSVGSLRVCSTAATGAPATDRAWSGDVGRREALVGVAAALNHQHHLLGAGRTDADRGGRGDLG